jgi:hypothetical protein
MHRPTGWASSDRYLIALAKAGYPYHQQEEDRLETLTDTLIERVNNLIEAGTEPLLTTTPSSVAIRELAARTEALQNAVREIALEVQEIAAHEL